MKIGDRIRPRIDETIRLYDKLLLVLSKTSVASQWVEQEVETAWHGNASRAPPSSFRSGLTTRSWPWRRAGQR